MNKIKKIILFTTVLLGVFGISKIDILAVESNTVIEPTTKVLVNSELNTPVCYIKQYNFGVSYQWTAGAGADDLSVSTSNVYYDLVGDIYFEENVVVNSYNPSFCPSYRSVAASYYSSLDEYSDFVYSTDFNTANPGQYAQSRYSTTNYFKNENAVTQIPCQLDQVGFIWEHHANFNYRVYVTIRYNNEMVDVSVGIPFLFGYSSTDFTVGGQSFKLRTGPNKVSICANSDINIPINDFAMAFNVLDL